MSDTKELNIESVAASHEEVIVRDGKGEKVIGKPELAEA